MMQISDRISVSLYRGNVPVSTRPHSKVSRTAIPIIYSLGAILLAILPIPGSMMLLAGAVLIATVLHDPDLWGEPVSRKGLQPLFSPALQFRMNIHLPNGDTLPEEAPRGIKDTGGCGSLNADLQLIESSAALTHWLKESPPHELAAFGDFYRAYQDGEGTLTSAPLRTALAEVFPWAKSGTDPFDLLAFLLDLSPKELKGSVRKTVYYNTPLHAEEEDLEVKDDEIPIITLPIRGSAPHLEKMLHSFYNERPIGLKRAEVGLDGKTRMYRANKIERRFATAPSELWFHIARFENVVQKSIFHEVPFLKSIFTPIEVGTAKNSSPVWVPQTIEIKPLSGPPKTYRLNGFVVHEGASPQEDRVKAYRFKDNVLYGCHHQWIVKISHPAQQEILSQAYLLHYEPV